MRIFSLLLLTAGLSSPAFAQETKRLTVSGSEVYQDHSINQYDDTNDPPQGYEIKVPPEHILVYSATPDDGDGRKCTISYDRKARTILIDAPDLQTDEGGCYAFLIFQGKIGPSKTVSYYIEQTGT